MPKHRIQLNEQQRQQLLDITSKGKVAVRIYKRAQILLLSNEGYKDTEIGEGVGVGVATVERVRQKFVQRGLDEALAEVQRPGHKRKLEARILEDYKSLYSFNSLVKRNCFCTSVSFILSADQTI